MSVLAEGAKLTVHVISVEPNFDSYPNRKTADGSIVYCHKTYFKLDDDEEFVGQLCSETNSVSYKEGDAIVIQIGKYTRNIYTFKLEQVIPNKERATAAFNELKKQDCKLGSIAPTILHIAGTPGAISLTMATTYHANRSASTPDDILATAEKFKEYLLDNTN